MNYSLLLTNTEPVRDAVSQGKDVRVEKMVAALMHNLGVPAHIKGYYFLKEAILLAVHDQQIVYSITKDLYPTVARLFGTTASRVSSGIRYAISIANDRCDTQTRQKYFGGTAIREKPTNSEFIITLAEHVRLTLKTSDSAAPE